KKVHAVISQLSTPGWVDKLHSIGNLSLGVKNRLENLSGKVDNLASKAGVLNSYLTGVISSVDQLVSVRDTVVSQIDNIYTGVKNGLNTVKNTVCISEDIDVDTGLCTGWVDIRICHPDPIRDGGSCPGF